LWHFVLVYLRFLGQKVGCQYFIENSCANFGTVAGQALQNVSGIGPKPMRDGLIGFRLCAQKLALSGRCLVIFVWLDLGAIAVRLVKSPI
jgi:hypothetical protein